MGGASDDNRLQRVLFIVLSFVLSLIVEIPVAPIVGELAKQAKPNDAVLFWFFEVAAFFGVVGTVMGVLSWVSGKLGIR